MLNILQKSDLTNLSVLGNVIHLLFMHIAQNLGNYVITHTLL